MKGESISDEQIVRNVVNGNTEEFRILVERYQSRIYSIGMRFFRNIEDALDFTQDVFIRAFSNLKTFKRRSPFRYWLTRIAYNLGISMKKSRKVESVSESSTIISDEAPPDLAHEKDEVKKTLLQEIEKLPEKYRICLDFYFFMGLSYKEICSITGYPVNTIKSHVLRAKIILRDSLRGTIAEEYSGM